MPMRLRIVFAVITLFVSLTVGIVHASATPDLEQTRALLADECVTNNAYGAMSFGFPGDAEKSLQAFCNEMAWDRVHGFMPAH